jgi:hypothetical protein
MIIIIMQWLRKVNRQIRSKHWTEKVKLKLITYEGDGLEMYKLFNNTVIQPNDTNKCVVTGNFSM